MAFLDNLTKEDTDIAYDITKKEYHLFATVSCLYPLLKKGHYRIISVIQFSIFVILLVSNTLALGVTAYLTLDDETVATQTIHFIVMNTIAFTILTTINDSRQNFSRFHTDIGSNNETYDTETMNSMDDLKIYLLKKQKVFYIALPMFIGVAGFLIVCLGPLTDYFTGEFGKEIYNEHGVSLNLPIPCWTPFGSNSTISYMMSITFQAGDHFIIVSTIVTLNIVMSVMAKHLYTELKLLISALNRLPQRTANLYQKIYGKKYNGDITEYFENAKLQYCYIECIEENIKHHQRILGLTHDMNTIWNRVLFIFFFTSTLSMAMSGILLFFGNGKITTLVNAIVMGVTEVFDVFFICWCGKSIGEASEELYLTLYKTKWFNSNKESAKLILIMMSMSKAPLRLYFNSITKLPADLETFSNLMNTAYSYFNLLYAFREEATK